MFCGKKVVAFTPAGRRRYLEILLPYIYRDRQEGLIDEYHLWLNTNDPDDIDFCTGIAESSQGFIQIILGDPNAEIVETQFGLSIYPFYKTYTDADTIYVRFDDDIVFVEKGAIRKLVQFRVENPDYFLVFANIINNGICSHLHQRLGMLAAQDGLLAGYDCLDPVGWGDPVFGEYVHRCFLASYAKKTLDRYKFSRWELYLLERFSIGCFAFQGSDFAAFDGIVGDDEETWLSQIKPGLLGRANAICGESLVSHYAFFTQREHIDGTDILTRYQEICLHECPLDPYTFSIICA